jgi:arylsulfatase A-like enzyme
MYGDFVAQVDHTVGRVLKALEKAGEKKDTLVIFTSDNGPVWYDKDVDRFNHDSAGGFRGMKGDAWEAGHRMPFIARWPGVVEPGSSHGGPTNFTDMMATFAEIAGQDLPKGAGADSVSQLSALNGSADDTPGRPSMVIGSIRYPVIYDGRWKLIPGLGSGGFSKPRRVQPEENGPRGQLYDLENDPGEQNNLWSERPDVVERLNETFQRYKEQGHSRFME